MNHSTHQHQLTGLRFFAAFLVFLSHIKWDSSTFPSLTAFFNQGFVGVSFFFMLSGFVLSYSYQEKLRQGVISKKNYIARRFIRLLPLHFLMALPFVISKLTYDKIRVARYAANQLFLHGLVPNSEYYYSFNAPSWSLSNEMVFYFAFMGLVFVSPKKLLAIALGLITVILTAAFISEYYFANAMISSKTVLSNWLFYIFPGFRMLEFIFGMLIYHFWKQGYFKKVRLTFLAIPLLFVAMWFGDMVPPSFRYSLYYLPFITLLLVSYLSDIQTVSYRFFAHPVMRLLGEASFAFYMIHWWVIISLERLFTHLGYNEFVFATIMLGCITTAAILVYFCIEKPLEVFLKKKVLKY